MLIRRNTNITSKDILKAFNSMLDDFQLTLTRMPSSIAIYEWYIATHDEDKDIDYFYKQCKNIYQYTLPSVQYITMKVSVNTHEDDE